MSVLTCVLETMGSSCSRPHSINDAEAAENRKVSLHIKLTEQVSAAQIGWLPRLIHSDIPGKQSADIDRRILQDAKADQHIHKLLLLGTANLHKIKTRLLCQLSILSSQFTGPEN